MKKLLFSHFTIIALVHLTGALHAANFTQTEVLSMEIQKFNNPTLTVTQASPTSIFMSWSNVGNSGDYTVEVKDLATDKIISNFITSSTSAWVPGITGGHSYRCSVTRNGTGVIIDLDVEPGDTSPVGH